MADEKWTERDQNIMSRCSLIREMCEDNLRKLNQHKYQAPMLMLPVDVLAVLQDVIDNVDKITFDLLSEEEK